MSRLNRMFLDHFRSTWAPKTLRMLSAEQSKLANDNELLGMPPAHDTPVSILSGSIFTSLERLEKNKITERLHRSGSPRPSPALRLHTVDRLTSSVRPHTLVAEDLKQ